MKAWSHRCKLRSWTYLRTCLFRKAGYLWSEDVDGRHYSNNTHEWQQLLPSQMSLMVLWAMVWKGWKGYWAPSPSFHHLPKLQSTCRFGHWVIANDRWYNGTHPGTRRHSCRHGISDGVAAWPCEIHLSKERAWPPLAGRGWTRATPLERRGGVHHFGSGEEGVIF